MESSISMPLKKRFQPYTNFKGVLQKESDQHLPEEQKQVTSLIRQSILFDHVYYLNAAKTKVISIGLSSHLDFQPVVRLHRSGAAGVELQLQEWHALQELFPVIDNYIAIPGEQPRVSYPLSEQHELLITTLYNRRQIIIRKKPAYGSLEIVFIAESSWRNFMKIFVCIEHAKVMCETVSPYLKSYFGNCVESCILDLREQCFGCTDISPVHACNKEKFVLSHLHGCTKPEPLSIQNIDGKRLSKEVFVFCENMLVEKIVKHFNSVVAAENGYDSDTIPYVGE